MEKFIIFFIYILEIWHLNLSLTSQILNIFYTKIGKIEFLITL